jgi:hypothetical protein
VSRNLVLIVSVGSESAAEAVLAEAFGAQQSGSFARELSTTGSEPATHLGAYARGLTDEQVVLLQGALQTYEGSWPDGLATFGLALLNQEAS